MKSVKMKKIIAEIVVKFNSYNKGNHNELLRKWY